jgi:hypothetical protein
MAITEKNNCRVCGSDNLIPILSLGEQFVTNFLDDPNNKAMSAPLDVVLCNPAAEGCGLVQLKHTVARDDMYKQYWYMSGVSKTMITALKDVAQTSERLANLNAEEIVVDIGSNDGTLLKQYETEGITRIGFEPSNLWNICNEKGIKTINDYFNKKSFKKECGEKKAKVVTSIAMFYDLDDPNSFVSDVKEILSPEGLWVIQMNYLGTMLEQNTFDNISHEHLEYYSLGSLEKLLGRHNLKVKDVEINDVNGGSFRTYIVPADSELEFFEGAEQRVENLREYEKDLGLEDKSIYDKFKERTEKASSDLRNFLTEEVSKGKKVYILGASTRGLVVLQHAGIDKKLITAAADKSQNKIGRYIVGTGIPIISLEQYREEKPDYTLVLPYQFKKEILAQESDYINNGGKMIFALPKLQILGKGDLK